MANALFEELLRKVINNPLKCLRAFSKQTKSAIAVVAEQSSNAARLMAVIDRKRPNDATVKRGLLLIADCAAVILLLKHTLVILWAKSELLKSVIVSFVLTLFTSILFSPRLVGFVVTILALALNPIMPARNFPKFAKELYFFTATAPLLTQGDGRASVVSPTVPSDEFQWLSLNPSVGFPVAICNLGFMATATLAVAVGNIW